MECVLLNPTSLWLHEETEKVQLTCDMVCCVSVNSPDDEVHLVATWCSPSLEAPPIKKLTVTCGLSPDNGRYINQGASREALGLTPTVEDVHARSPRMAVERFKKCERK